jgi:hypothetical protein
MSNLSKVIDSFNIQDSLNPKVWDNPNDPNQAKLKKDIQERLLEIAYEFIDFIGLDFFISDIILTGSLSNYNWSEYSDFDLHILVDMAQFEDSKIELYKELFNLKKMLFNEKHDITIKKYEVELYVQDADEEHTSTGVYSVLYKQWDVVPEKQNFRIDKEKLKDKAEQWMRIIDGVIENVQDDDLEDAKELIKKYRDKLKQYRKCGLEKKGEFSYENLVFKILRRNGYIEKLINIKDKLMDKKLSIENRDI